MAESRVSKGPWTHRVLTMVFSVLFGVLVYWLLGFILGDIGTWPGPSVVELEREMLDPALVAHAERLESQIADIRRNMEGQRDRQRILRESTTASQQTMTQLLEVQRLSIERGVQLSEEEQQALAETQQLFLANQRQFQQLNQEIAGLSEELRRLEEQQRQVERQIAEQREAVARRYDRLMERHMLKVAGVKLLVLLPLLAAGVVAFLKWRNTLYAPLIYAYGIAALVTVGMVMHEYFPARYFKYVLILAALALVAWILVFLLRMMAFPRRDWLLKQYRDAYERFICPLCEYPIRRGPLKYGVWNRRGLERPIAVGNDAPADEPYTCPVCGTALFEECPVCHGVRHALLPACEKCGAEKPIETITAPRDAAATTS